MELVTQLSDSIAYAIHQATYNPDAEAFAKANAEKAKRATDAKQQAATSAKAKQDAADAAAKAKADAEAAEKEKTDRATFSVTRLFGTVFGIVFTVLMVFLLLVFGVYGASLATNLNVYRSLPYKLLYAIYGFLFFFLVIPYVLVYRWYWKGLKPKFYSLIPLLPHRLENRWAVLLFSWISYKPDSDVELLQEWVHG